MEQQHHGFVFEDAIVLDITGFTKEEYQKKLPSGYTAAMDIVKDIHSEKDYSIKVSSNGKSVGCGDILRFNSHFQNGFTMLIGCWFQKNSTTKTFYRIYEFNIKPEHYQAFWGGLDNNNLTPFVNYVKSIEHGKAAQMANRTIWKQRRDALYATHGRGIVSIDAKIDSKKQRRVQCSIKIEDMIRVCSGSYKEFNANLPYRGIELPYDTNSSPRSFK